MGGEHPPRALIVLLALAAVVGVVVSLAAWAFLELIHQIQVWVFADLPGDLGYRSPPMWFYVVVLGLAGLAVALAIVRLPGNGGHVPAEGLKVAQRLVTQQHDVAPAASVAAVGAPTGHHRFTAEAHAAVPPGSGLDVDSGAIVKHPTIVTAGERSERSG